MDTSFVLRVWRFEQIIEVDRQAIEPPTGIEHRLQHQLGLRGCSAYWPLRSRGSVAQHRPRDMGAVAVRVVLTSWPTKRIQFFNATLKGRMDIAGGTLVKPRIRDRHNFTSP